MDLYDSATKTTRTFASIDPNRVRMYSCGPTVYSFQHIGNLRAYLFADLLKRALIFSGYRVFHVMNITDVGHLTDDADLGDDKVEVSAKAMGLDAWSMTEKYKAKFFEDCAGVNILPPDIVCRATDHIAEQIDLACKLEALGYTYRTDDGLYFDVNKAHTITDTSLMAVSASSEYSRVDADTKRSGADFALWKFSPSVGKRQMEWDSPWGKGFPGWHLECSAMAMKYLGSPFDIHTGGVDHIPVHHVNEIIQSESASGVKFANYWVHGGWLSFNDTVKMSKSKGNTILADDLLRRGYDLAAFRYLTLTAHYRSPLQFTWEALDAAAMAVKRIRKEMGEEPPISQENVSPQHLACFRQALHADLNLPEALAVLWTLLKDPLVKPAERAATLLQMDRVLGLRLSTKTAQGDVEIPAPVLAMIQQRTLLKQQRAYREADQLREAIQALGYEVGDTPEGPVLRTRS